MKEKKRICFDLIEFTDFFSLLELNCSFNDNTGNIESVDGILLKGEIKRSE